MNEHDPYNQILQQTMGDLRLGRPRTHEGLCVLPLVSTAECSAKYVLLEQAISRGTLTITEVSEAGSVPYLAAVNKGPWPVLIFDGEELVGAKQNRICNATILVGVGKSVLPVSCVEQGRWSRKSVNFSSGDYAAHPSLRMEKELLVRKHAAMAPTRDGAHRRMGVEPQEMRASRYSGAQGRVWEEVAEATMSLGVESPTMALADNYKTRGRDLDDYLKALGFDDDKALEHMVAAMVFFNGRFVCVDFLQPAKRFHRLYPKLLRGYALEALVAANKHDFWTLDGVLPPDTSEPAELDPEAFALRLFAELKNAEIQTQTAVDLGQDLRLETKTVTGAGLAWNEALIQLSLFPKKAA